MIKQVQLKVFRPGNRKFDKHIVRAPKGERFISNGVEQVLLRVARLVEKQYPDQEYHLVPIGPAAFNFVHAGPKEQAAAS